MSIEHNAILLENFRGSLAGYERSMLGAMTASAAFFLISLRLDSTSSVEGLYGELLQWQRGYCPRVLLLAWRLCSLGDSKGRGSALWPQATRRTKTRHWEVIFDSDSRSILSSRQRALLSGDSPPDLCSPTVRRSRSWGKAEPPWSACVIRVFLGCTWSVSSLGEAAMASIRITV